MTFDTVNLIPVLPEILMLIAASTVLLVDLYVKDANKGVLHTLTLIGLAIALATTILVGGGERLVVLEGHYVRDTLSDVLKAMILIVGLLVFVYSKDYLRDRDLATGEYYALALSALLGMMIMVSAGSFLAIYLGLELLALCLYALVAFDRDSQRGAEAAMKYFVLGALGSGMLLYGISMLYGATGSLELAEVAKVVAEQGMDNLVLVFGLAFLVVGIGFKFGAVPFHMWVPDIYEGAPTPVVLLLGSAPKIAALALAVRLLIDGLGGLLPDWQGMLVILSVLSMGLGNLLAIAQTNVKRMLAYSTISHVGFIFLGLLAGTADGFAAAMFYAIVYALMAAGAFGILLILSRRGFDAEKLDDLKGLNDRDTWYAAVMALMMFSMAGVPPFVGFMAKLFVLKAVVDIGMTWLAIVAVFFSIIGAFYYLRIVWLIYFDKPTTDAPLTDSGGVRVAMSLNGVAVLGLGLFPAALLAVCQAAFA
ncbi:proton-translocating NADH-quinone oxidoreductase, chain N [Thioflavicoccus mobilis 8321]|uniref:NADH-quinone oxidoreductase subunit N n=1 Tax=Thioflavicoccus mobilis 8321 TaxID=765912 RepID=L0GVW0_9GAMM|nr:NADH-quinone oxidoreductase subunit NuoN [Thioflavicoccus mobilis]AGA89444.1 proton-translocating NADH-quinone oxidoreductase, chain N [Thioflavicoccus mobilis 8321]